MSREKKPDARLDPAIRGPTRMPKMDQPMALAGSKMPRMDKTMKPAESSRMPKIDKTMKPAESSRMPKIDKAVKPAENSRMPKIDKTVKPAESSQMVKMDKTKKLAESSRMARVNQSRAPPPASRMGGMDQSKAPPPASRIGVMGRSVAPAIPTRSTYTTQRDQEFASQQTNIDQLPANRQAEQEQWAQRQLAMSGECPHGFGWARVWGGYRCFGGGGNHIITDDSLASGVIEVQTQLVLPGPVMLRRRRLMMIEAALDQRTLRAAAADRGLALGEDGNFYYPERGGGHDDYHDHNCPHHGEGY